jgi:transposase
MSGCETSLAFSTMMRACNDQLRGTSARKSYPSDVSGDEWALVVPYLTLLPEEAERREHALREVPNGLRYVIKTGASWRWMPNGLPPWAAVYQQAQRWLAAGCFETLAEDLRSVLRQVAGRKVQAGAAILDSRALRSTPESGARAGYDGARRKKGSKLHLAVGTLGQLLALHARSPASADDCAEVGRLARAVQASTGQRVELAYVDQGYTGARTAEATRVHCIELEVIQLPEALRQARTASGFDQRHDGTQDSSLPGCEA